MDCWIGGGGGVRFLGGLDCWGIEIARGFGLMGDLGVAHIELCPGYTLAMSKSKCLIQMAGQNRVKSYLLFVAEIWSPLMGI